MTTTVDHPWLQINVLGPLTLERAGRTIELGGARQRRLLAALVLAGPDGAGPDRLAELVWDDQDRPDNAGPHLRTLVSRLRGRLDDPSDDQSGRGSEDRPSTIANRAEGGYRLDADQVEVDSWRFERLAASIASGADGEPDEARARRAVALYRGMPFADLGDLDGLAGTTARLEETRLDLEERLLLLGLERGDNDQVVTRAAALLAEHPFREQLRVAEITALYRLGRQADALRRLDQHRALMAEELGLDPAPEIADLERRILDHDPELRTPASEGTPLRSYRLSDELGRGAFAIVRRGVQPGLDRDVAVKIIRAEYANRPDFIRRFEAEAHLVARLEHPHIVPLYDYWREPDRACLVFRYLRGGTLEQLLVADGALGRDALARLTRQVGDALAISHRAGIVHRDVKPANVLLDDERNFYLGDFGIAIEQVDAGEIGRRDITVGTPAYASPEQLRREPVGPATDVYGLGVTLFEAMTGRLPYGDAASAAELMERQLTEPLPPVTSIRPDLPTAVDELLAQATAKDVADRFDSVASFVAAFEGVVAAGDESTGTVSSLHRTDGSGVRLGVSTARGHEGGNPFKGLEPFTEADAGDFFGRDTTIDRLVASLSQRGPAGKVLAVVGPSGVGKSSAVRAGLVPRLRQGAVTGSDRWFTAAMVPGTAPYDELTTALLSVAPAPMADTLDQLADDHRGVARAVVQLLADLPDTELLLVIDQFEELFTQSAPEDARRFLDALVYALEEPACRLRLVVTIRADFWDQPLRHAGFAQLLDGSTVHLSTLGVDGLEEAVTEPIHRAGGQLERGLVSRIVTDVADQPMALPLLQFALTELWDRADGERLTVAGYEAIGGVAGAVASLADAQYDELDGPDRESVRHLFGALVTPGEGGPDTRRRMARRDLGSDPAVDRLIERMGRARLLAFDRDPVTREQTVELAHEALLRTWPRLTRWIDEDRHRLRLHRHLTAAASAWDGAGRDEGDLYAGTRLAEAEEWTPAVTLTEREQAFVAASIAARTAAEDTRRRQIRRLRRALAAVAVVAVVAAAAGVAAVSASRRADQQAANARTLVLAAAAEQLATSRPDLSLQLAVEAVSRQDTARTRDALFAALHQEPRFAGVVDQLGPGCLIGTAADGAVGAAAETGPLDSDGLRPVSVVTPGDPETEPASLTLPTGSSCAIPTADGRRVLGHGPDGVTVVDLADPSSSTTLPGDFVGAVWSTDGDTIAAIGPAPRGRWLATQYRSPDWSMVASVELDGRQIEDIHLVGDLLVVGTAPPTLVDFATGDVWTLDALTSFRHAMLSPDTTVVATVDSLHLTVFDTASGERRWRVALPGSGILSSGVTIDPDSSAIAVDTAAGVVLYDLETGQQLGPIIEISGGPLFVDPRTLVVLDDDHRLIRFDLGGSSRQTQLVAWDSSGGVAAPDGSIASTIENEQPVLIDLATGERSPLASADFRPGIGGVLIGVDEATEELVVIDEGEERRADLSAHWPDGLELMRVPKIEYGRAVFLLHDPWADGLSANHVLVVEIDTGEVVGSFPAPEVFLTEQLGPDELVLGSRVGEDRVVDVTGAVTIDLPVFDGGWVSAAAPGPGGDLILGLVHGDTIRWSRQAGEVVESFTTGHDSVLSVFGTDDGAIAHYASGEVVQWRWGSAQPLARLAPPGEYGGLAVLSPAGTEVLVPTSTGLYSIPIAGREWIELACSLVGDTLDRQAWLEVTGLAPPDEPPCR